MNPILGPKTLTDYILNQTAAKSKKSNLTLLLQGILAGLYIAIGAVGSIKVSASFPVPGLGDFLGAVVFPVGIIAIIVMQAELYTSNCMIMASVYAGQSKLKQIVKILSLILFANLLGAVIASGLTVTSGLFNETAVNLLTDKAISKTTMPVGQLFASAVFCNIIVCTGVCLAYGAKDEIVKIITLWLAITVFVLSGTEHVVANMYYLFAALFYGGAVSAKGIIYNLLVSGVGNFIGGGVVVASINYLLAYKTQGRD